MTIQVRWGCPSAPVRARVLILHGEPSPGRPDAPRNVRLMILRTMLFATLLVSALSPLVAPGAAAWTCIPGQDNTAGVVGTGFETYYEKVTRNGGLTLVEIWQETNGEAGLQTSKAMSCVGKADTRLRSACLGCPIPM